MAYKGLTLMKCPECMKFGVSTRLRPDGEDHYACRYCGWWAYCDGTYQYDLENRQKLADLNPTHEQRPID